MSSPFPDGAQVLTLPVPPSSNRYWRTTARYSRARKRWRAITYKSAEAKEYQKSAQNLALAAGMRPIPGPTEVTLIVVWYREKRIGDLTNRIKVVEDALQGAAYDDDKQVSEAHEYRFDTERHNPRLEICVLPKGEIQESVL